MASPFDRWNVPTLIDAAGTLTRLSGSMMDAEVTRAMAEAAGGMVRIDQLQAAASRQIAAWTGAEAALVTAGASAGLTLAAAACLAGHDLALMDRLPDTTGLRRQIVVPRSHRNGYDHALRAAGAEIVEVGVAERTRDPQTWEIEAAIGPQTVAVAYCVGFSPLPLETVVAAAHGQGVPLIVDAAAALPPRANLRRFIEAGADLVVFSGGKAIRGPQATGILCGRRELVGSAALQMWDLDVLPALWDPPAELVPVEVAARGVPNHGIGRGMKVGKEQIAGLLVALERFLAVDEVAENARLSATTHHFVAALKGIHGATVSHFAEVGRWDKARLILNSGAHAIDLARRLQNRQPAIYLDAGFAPDGILNFDPFCLRAGEERLVAAAIREELNGEPP